MVLERRSEGRLAGVVVIHFVSSAKEMSSKSTVSRSSSSGKETERKLELQELRQEDLMLDAALLRSGVVSETASEVEEAMLVLLCQLLRQSRLIKGDLAAAAGVDGSIIRDDKELDSGFGQRTEGSDCSGSALYGLLTRWE